MQGDFRFEDDIVWWRVQVVTCVDAISGLGASV
jgi:hypothetical protein